MTTTTPGLDLTALWGGYASSIMQAIAESQPAAPYGGVVCDPNPPDVFAYPVLKRYLWLQPSGTGIYSLFFFDDDVAHDWVNILTLSIPTNSIVNAQIVDNTIQLGKLSVTGGAAGQIPVVNAGITDFEFKNPADALVANTVAVSKLIKPGTSDRMLTNIGGVNDWTLLSAILSYIADNSIGTAKITRGAASSNGLFLVTNTAGTLISWTAFSPSTHIPAATVPVNRLVPGTSGQTLVITGGVPVWTTPTAVAAKVATLRYTPASGTAAQSIPDKTATTLLLNASATSDVEGIIVAVGTNEFELFAGSYLIRVNTKFMGVDNSKVRIYLYNKSDAAEVTGAESVDKVATDDDYLNLSFEAVVVLTGTKTLDLRMYHDSGSAATVGNAASLAGKNETYTTITVIKYA